MRTVIPSPRKKHGFRYNTSIKSLVLCAFTKPSFKSKGKKISNNCAFAPKYDHEVAPLSLNLFLNSYISTHSGDLNWNARFDRRGVHSPPPPPPDGCMGMAPWRVVRRSHTTEPVTPRSVSPVPAGLKLLDGNRECPTACRDRHLPRGEVCRGMLQKKLCK